MDKNHDCISKVRKELKEANSDLGWIRFKLSTIRDTSKENSVLKTGTEIEFSYKHKKRNGGPQRGVFYLKKQCSQALVASAGSCLFSYCRF